MDKWLVVHHENSFKENSRVLGFKDSIHNVKLLKPNDIVVYYFNGARLKGSYKVTDISINQEFEPSWSSPNQILLEPIIELANPVDFKPLISGVSFLKGKGSGWGRSLQGVHAIKKLTDDDFKLLDGEIKNQFAIENYVLVEDFENELDQKVNKSRYSGRKDRLARIRKANKKLETYVLMSTVYKRNPDVIAEVLIRANGICEECGKLAPFNRKSDNSPYLEVHHKVPLSQGGHDDLINTIAVCPNCHKKAHFG